MPPIGWFLLGVPLGVGLTLLALIGWALCATAKRGDEAYLRRFHEGDE